MKSFLAQLEQAGYFKPFAPRDANQMKQSVSSHGWSGLFRDHGLRLHAADAEDLAEQGVADFLRRVEPFFKTQKVVLPRLTEDFATDGSSYSITVGDTAHPVWRRSEFSPEHKGYHAWGLSMARAFAIVDGLLEAAGSPERVYAVN